MRGLTGRISRFVNVLSDYAAPDGSCTDVTNVRHLLLLLMKIKLVTLVIVASFALLPHASGQGSLTPSGPPGPSMLTLSQVEPRTPVDAVHTPGNSAFEFIIANAGSYYLTTNIIGVSSEQGVNITASDVTPDLSGFAMIGPSSAYTAIVISAGATNVMVWNGIVSGWGTLYNGVLSLGNDVALENLTLSGELAGIACFGDGGVIRNCTVTRTGQNGLYLTGSNYLITCNNFIENNTGNNGNGAAIYVGSSNNHIDGNCIVGSSSSGYGLWVAGTNNIVVRNSVSGNGANNYAIYVEPNDVGPVGSASTNSSPWGNISN
jgi:hypothetical protein